jgi:hypothetical protein
MKKSYIYFFGFIMGIIFNSLFFYEVDVDFMFIDIILNLIIMLLLIDFNNNKLAGG